VSRDRGDTSPSVLIAASSAASSRNVRSRRSPKDALGFLGDDAHDAHDAHDAAGLPHRAVPAPSCASSIVHMRTFSNASY
jgi:hypothetical protein